MGMKAELNAPSAKRRRNRFGKRKATKKASATGPEPRLAAINISLTKPNARLASVATPTVAKFFSIDMPGSFRNPADKEASRKHL